MHISVIGPMSLDMLPLRAADRENLPDCYPAPIVSSIVNGYLDRGMRVTAVSGSPNLNSPIKYRQGALTLWVVPRTRPRSALRMFPAERTALLDVLTHEPPDVIHAQWSYEYAAAALDSGVPTLVTIRDYAPRILRLTAHYRADIKDKSKQVAYRALRLLLNNQVLRRGNHFSVTSPYMLEQMPDQVKSRARVIPNHVERFSPECPSSSRGSGRSVVTVSNGFSGWKNVAKAIEAFHLSDVSRSGWTHELVGRDLEQGGPASKWAEKRGMASGIRFRGPLPHNEVLSVVSRASVMLHPSLEESFGMTVLEAMSLGVPVVGGTESGNVPHLLADGAGMLCDVTSPEAMASALDSVVQECGIASRIAEEARRRAQTCYARDPVIDAYLAYLHDIVEARQGG